MLSRFVLPESSISVTDQQRWLGWTAASTQVEEEQLYSSISYCTCLIIQELSEYCSVLWLENQETLALPALSTCIWSLVWASTFLYNYTGLYAGLYKASISINAAACLWLPALMKTSKGKRCELKVLCLGRFMVLAKVLHGTSRSQSDKQC